MYQDEEELAPEPTLNLEEWESVLQDLINSPAFAKAPLLPDDAFSRESLYTREDDVFILR